jgi:rhamnogalacturonyl hydrolase YesR
MSVDHPRTLTTCLISVLSLSSYLFTATSSPQYSAAAAQSIQFVLNHMSNGAMIFDTFDMATCWMAWTFTWNGGVFLEGLSDYMRATSDSSYAPLYVLLRSYTCKES